MIEEQQEGVDTSRWIFDGLALALIAAAAIPFFLYHLARPAQAPGQAYDFPTYYFAHRAWRAGLPPYSVEAIREAAAEEQHPGKMLAFLYPPSFLLFIDPLFRALACNDAFRVWLVLSHAALLATVLLMIRVRGGPLRAVQNVLLVLIALSFWPIQLSLDLGQANPLLLVLLALVLSAHTWRWPSWGIALLLALGCSVKIIPLVLLPLFALRDEWRTLACALLWLAATIIGVGITFGWNLWASFFAAIGEHGAHRAPAVTNISLRGTLWRLVDAGYLPHDGWATGIFYALAVVLGITCLAVLAIRRRANLSLQASFLLVTFFLLSSPTAIHHLTLLFLVYASLVDLVTHPRCPRGLFAVVVFSYFFTGLYWGQYQLEPYPAAALVSSLPTWGLLLLFGVLVYLFLWHGEQIDWPVLPRSPVGVWQAGRSVLVASVVGSIVLLLTAGPARADGEHTQPFGTQQQLALKGRPAVADVVVLAPDADSFLRQIAQWTDTTWYPVLLDDPYWSRLFIERFRPARVVIATAGKPVVLSPALARRTLLAAWSENALDDVPDDGPLAVQNFLKQQLASPIGAVLVGPGAPTGLGGVALAAGRRQPVLFLPPTLPSGRRAVRAEAVHAIDKILREQLAGEGYPVDGLWQGIDVVTLAADLPLFYEGLKSKDPCIYALDDALFRSPRSELERDAYVGRLTGDERQAVYQAMCSLFLPVDTALTFCTYRGNKPFEPPWLDSRTMLTFPSEVKAASSEDVGTRERWHQLMGRRNPFDLVLVCTGGAENSWGTQSGTATTEDVPLSGPAIVHWVHSYSAKRPWDVDTIAGRWLASGAYAFYGSVCEPYLHAFRTPSQVVYDWREGLPFVAACRHQRFKPWRLIYLGDPLLHRERTAPSRVPVQWGTSLDEERTRLVDQAGAALDAPIDTLQTLALRHLQYGALAQTRTVADALLAGRVSGPRARSVAALALHAAGAMGDSAAVRAYYERFDVGGTNPESDPGTYVVYLDSMRRLAQDAAAASDTTQAIELYRRLRAFRPGNNSVRRFADEGLAALREAPAKDKERTP